MPSTARQRLDIRINSHHKQLIEKAARAVGQTVSQFVTLQAVTAAEKTLEQQQIRTLSNRDRDAFLRILDHAKPNAVLKKAAARFAARHAR